MVGAARCWVAAAATHALDDGIKRHIDFQHKIQLHASGFHGIGLGNRARKAVEQKAFGAIGLGNALFDQIDDQLIADQAA